MSRLMRRRFLQSLGLGLGASVLHPIARTLINEADGQTVNKRRALIFVNGVMNYTLWAPGAMRYSTDAQTLMSYDWPAALGGLVSRRNEMVILDNLHNDINETAGNDFEINHGLGYGFLSCIRPDGSPKDLGPPNAITIDQYLADTISTDAPRKSVLFGISGHGYKRNFDEELNIFARGPDEALPHVIKASVLFERLFGGADASGTSDAEALALREQRLTDILHQDIERLRSRLAAPERERLESYQLAFEEFDMRRDLGASLSCEAPMRPMRGNQDEEMRDMMAMGTLALKCGLTNVVAVNCGATSNHNEHMPHYSFHDKFIVHGTDSGVNVERQHYNPIRAIWNYNCELVANAMDELEATPEGNGTALDGTLVAMTCARGIRTGNDTHHVPIANGGRYPVLVGGRPPGMNLDGRYISYDLRSKGMVDFWRTCCDSLGVCPDRFAPMARNSQGPLTELSSGGTGMC
ncbi:MAG: DUF1552 domain-containing protein [Myxococcota bacterium]